MIAQAKNDNELTHAIQLVNQGIEAFVKAMSLVNEEDQIRHLNRGKQKAEKVKALKQMKQSKLKKEELLTKLNEAITQF